MTKWTPEQQDAIDFKHEDYKNIIVSAGAGSGKTAVLKERVIEIIKRGVSINNLLILTFTNDAAHEMKDRIREAISKDKSLKDELNYIDSSYISTFDSFSLSIVKKYSYLLNVGKEIDVADDAIIYLEKKRIIDDIFDRLYEEKNDNFLKMIDHFTVKKDDDIKDNIINISNSLDLKYDKKKYLDEYIDKYYTDDFINSMINDYSNVIIDMFDDINEILLELKDMVDIDYYNSLEEAFEPLFLSKTYEDLRNNIDNSIPPISKAKDKTEEAKETKNKISKVMTEIKELIQYDRNELKEIYLSTKDYVSIIIDIIKELDERLWNVKKEMNMYDFSDISKMGIKIIKEHEDIREELKNHFYEIIIDEYQDTSDLQDEFISLIANDNVYVVGDIKQSIYKFRNANPLLFKEKYNNYSLDKGGHKIDLTMNFRSRKEVVDDINLIFSNLMTESIGDADYKKTHQMISGNTAYLNEGKTSQNNNLEIINYNYDKEYTDFSREEIEAFYIAEDIKNKIENNYKVFDKKKEILRDANYDDFTIILDRKAPFELYKKIFQYFQIPLSIKTASNIVLEDEIVLIKNIIKLLITPIDKRSDIEFKYAFTSIARSYLFEMSDQEIFDIITKEDYSSNLLDIINSIITNIDSLSVNEIMNEIIDKFDIYSKFILVGDVNSRINRITSIIKIINNLSKINYSIYDVYDYLSEIIDDKYKIEVETDNASLNSVKIINTHKSKGLEYPICYYASMHNEFNKTEFNDRLLYSKKYGIITPYFNEGFGTTFVKELYKRERKIEDISERIRLFYVALTRAREKMIIVTSFKDKPTISVKKCKSVLDFLNYVKPVISKKIVNIDINDLNVTRDYNSIKKDNYSEKIEKTDDLIVINEIKIDNEIIEKERISKETYTLETKEEKDNKNYGTKMHEIFELIDFKKPDYSLIDNETKKKIERFISLINIDKVLNIYKEYEFLYEENNHLSHGIVDLILEYNDVYKIIDYKLSNITDENYKKQLYSYKDYLASKTNKKIEVYLFSINKGELKML